MKTKMEIYRGNNLLILMEYHHGQRICQNDLLSYSFLINCD